MGCCGGMNFLQIPGNIKQNFAPFVLNRGASINSAVKSSPSVGGPPQKFTFRGIDSNSPDTSVGRLAMFPNALTSASQLFKDDISFSNLGLDLNGILNILPSVQIREYLPDTKLDQTLNFFSDFLSKIFQGKDIKDQTKDAGDNTEDTEKKSSNLMKRLSKVVDEVLKMIESKSFMDVLAPDDADGNPGANTDDIYSYIVKFPYTVYYKLQSCVTTNIYELPCVPSNNFLHNSDGQPGWTKDSGGMRLLPGFAKNIPVIGKMIDTLFGNLGINYTPWWDAESGSKTKAPEVELKFSLFNDNLEAAVVNFIFINTIIQNNRWLQYHIFQHSSALYDVIIAGIGKYSACMGQFDVQYKGALRQPSDALLNQLKAHVGPRYNTNIVSPVLIKIPDVYDVTMKFQSLLPQNFNTFIFNYMSKNQLVSYDNSVPLYKQSDGTYSTKKEKDSKITNETRSDAYQQSGLGNFKRAIDMVINKAKETWDQG